MFNGRGGHGTGPHDEMPLGLPVTADAVGDACREAGLLFVDGVATDWGKAELAMWLAGPYRDATRFGGTPRPSVPPAPPTQRAAGITEQLDRIVREARWHVLASLEALALPQGQHRFVDRALAAQHLAPRKDSRGVVVWVPVCLPGMRLCARVLSLFAADYLTRPSDYVSALFVCHRCEAVVFDREARRRGDCGAHVSGRFSCVPAESADDVLTPPRRTTQQWRS
jgi:hypothetical protein